MFAKSRTIDDADVPCYNISKQYEDNRQAKVCPHFIKSKQQDRFCNTRKVCLFFIDIFKYKEENATTKSNKSIDIKHNCEV